MPPLSEARRPRQYRPRSPRRRQRRQLDPESDEEFTSGSEDGIESDSDDEDEPLPPTAVSASPPSKAAGNALTTFTVGGTPYVTSLPVATADIAPPLNVGLLPTDIPGLPASETTIIGSADVSSHLEFICGPTHLLTTRAGYVYVYIFKFYHYLVVNSVAF